MMIVQCTLRRGASARVAKALVRTVMLAVALLVFSTSAMAAFNFATDVPDAGLRQAIANQLAEPEAAVTQADLEGMGTLSADAYNISDLTGLSLCTGLQILSLEGNEISDLSPISGMTTLISLDVRSNVVVDLEPIAGLTNLIVLDASFNDISNISWLATLTHLASVELRGTMVVDIGALAALPNLGFVDLTNARVEDLAALAGNMALDFGNQIGVKGNPLSFVAVYGQIPQLWSRGVTVESDIGVEFASVGRMTSYGVPGTATDDSNDYYVEITGVGITDVEVTTPWGDTFRASDVMPDPWDGSEFEYSDGTVSFEIWSNGGRVDADVMWDDVAPIDWADLATGDTTVTVSYLPAPIAWTATVNFDGVTQPTQEPILTSPAHGDTDVSLQPLLQWSEWLAAGADSRIEVFLMDQAADEDLVGIMFDTGDVTSWQVPEMLPAGTLVELEFIFANVAETIIDDVPVQVWAETEANPTFTLAPPGVTDVSLWRGVENGPPPYDSPENIYAVEVSGTELTNLEITTPWGEAFDLSTHVTGWPETFHVIAGDISIDGGIEGTQWWVEVEWESLSPTEWAALDTTNTSLTISYTGGSWSGSVNFGTVTQPSDIPEITGPGDGDTDVGRRDEFTWTAWPSPTAGGGVWWELGADPSGEWEDLHEEDHAPSDTAEWTPDFALEFDTEYEFYVAFADRDTVEVSGVDVTLIAFSGSEIQFSTAETGVVEVDVGRAIDYSVSGFTRDDSHEYWVEVVGVGITDVEVQTPWGETVSASEFLPPGWAGEFVWADRGQIEFDAGEDDDGLWIEICWCGLADSQWAALSGTSTVTVTHGAGTTWSQSVSLPDQPTQEPLPTSPIHRSVQGTSLTVTWAAWAETLANKTILVELEETLDHWTGTEFEDETTLAGSATEWTVSGLPISPGYFELELFFANVSSSVLDGADVYTGSETVSNITFATSDALDDAGNHTGDAVAVSVPSTTSGAIEYSSDIDFYSFTATTGTAYDLLLSLPGGDDLDEAVLWLFDTDGTTLLAWDAGGNGWAGRLTWTAQASGTYYVAVDAGSPFGCEGAYGLNIQTFAPAPTVPTAVISHPVEFLAGGGGTYGGASMTTTGATSDDESVKLYLFDLSTPLAPTEAARGFAWGFVGGAFRGDGSRYYYGDESNAWSMFNHGELVALNTTDSLPEMPEAARTMIQHRRVHAVAASGDCLYAVTQGDDGSQLYLEIYDISGADTIGYVGQTAAMPILAGWTEPDVEAAECVVEGNRVYILVDGGAVYVVDVTTPAAPALMAQVDLDNTDRVRTIDVQGGLLWYNDNWNLKAVDLTNPASPDLLSANLPLGGQPQKIEVDDAVAFIGATGIGVLIVDITDPDSPAIAETIVVPTATGSFGLVGAYLYVPTSAGKMLIFENGPPDLEINVLADYDWTYPNTPDTTGGTDQHATVSVSITGGTEVPGEQYQVTFGQGAPAPAAVTDFQITQPVTWAVDQTSGDVAVAGGLVDSSTPGSYMLHVTVTGLGQGQVATATVPLVLRVYGDVDDSGAVDTSDKLEINRELNGIATTATLRELDLTGDDVVDTNDKLQVNRLLNGIAVP
jgi:hypothetical protein